MSAFHQTRLGIRAVLISALLVLGHVFLTTVLVTADVAPMAQFVQDIKTMSYLVFLTLLWTAFTLVEAVDVGLMPLSVLHDGGHGEGLMFERTWYEFVINSVILASWAVNWDGLARVMNAISPFVSSEKVVIPAAFGVVLLAHAALQVQMVLSLARYVYFSGFRSVLTPAFWNRKTGHWTERIMLGEVVVVPLDEAALVDEEKVFAPCQ